MKRGSLRNTVGRSLSWALVLALGLVRVADAHVHLCLDGEEAPATVHAGDAHLHHAAAHEAGAPHQDRDVDFDGGPPAKKVFVDDLPALSAGTLIFLPLRAGIARTAYVQRQPLRTFRLLLPPSRGPPA